MTISITPRTLATGTNNGNKQVSKNVWNAGHLMTGSALSTVAFDDDGNALEIGRELTLEQFGGVADGATDNLAAWNALIDFIEAEDRNNIGAYRGARKVLFPGEHYYFSDELEIKNTLHLIGCSAGLAGGIGTKLRWPANKCGFRIQRYDTTGTSGAGSAGIGGDGTIIEGFYMEGGGGTPDLSKPGIHLRARAIVRNCSVVFFPGPGILILADVAVGSFGYGNANCWQVSNCRLGSNLYGGMYVRGGDVNAGLAFMVDASSNARYGIYDASFLGNTYVACHADANGLAAASYGLDQTSVVSDGTYRYQLVDGQDANAAGTPPTTGASNSVWRFQGLGAAAPWAGIMDYSTYTGDYVSGGGYFIEGINARSVLVGCYSEGGQADPIIHIPSMSVGGFMSQGQGTSLGDGGQMMGSTTGITNHNGFAKVSSNPETGVSMEAGIGSSDEETVWRGKHSTNHPLGWKASFGVGGFVVKDLITNYGGTPVYKCTGPSTTEEYGTGAAQPYYLHAINFALGSDSSTARRQDYAAAAPTSGTHARGEFVWNSAPSAAGTLGWTCVTGGTPGTWKAVSGIAA